MLDDYLRARSDRCSGCLYDPEHQGCRCESGEWATFVTALRKVASTHAGRVEWTYVRPLIRDHIQHKHVGQLTQRAKREGLLVEVDITRSKDERGKNAGRLEPVYELRRAA